MSRTLEAAHKLRAELEDVLGDLVATVTLDGSGVKPQTRAAVIIQAPKVTYTTFASRELEWTIIAAAGTASDPLKAWARLDPILTRLEEAGLNLKSAEPATLDLAGAGTLPAYEITFNPLED